MPDIVFLNASTGESKKLDLKTVTKKGDNNNAWV